MLRLSLSARRLSSGKFDPFPWQDHTFAVKFSRSKRKTVACVCGSPSRTSCASC